MKTLKFVKEEGKWYVDLPNWKGSRADLEMVAGADLMLDYFAIGHYKVSLRVSLTPFKQSHCLTFLNYANKSIGGAYYIITLLNEYDVSKNNFVVWLCDVLKFVFDDFPSHIYFVVQSTRIKQLIKIKKADVSILYPLTDNKYAGNIDNEK